MEDTKKTERYNKMVATMVAKHGSVEAWKNWMRQNGSEGGKKAKNNKHFRDNPGLASRAGKISAEVRRRNKDT